MIGQMFCNEYDGYKLGVGSPKREGAYVDMGKVDGQKLVDETRR